MSDHVWGQLTALAGHKHRTLSVDLDTNFKIKTFRKNVKVVVLIEQNEYFAQPESSTIYYLATYEIFTLDVKRDFFWRDIMFVWSERIVQIYL